MPFRYEQNVESEDGNNVYLTIDETIQSICEKYMQKGVEDNNVLNKGVCIAMDVNTGAILAMVTTDGYDLNNPYELSARIRRKSNQLQKRNRRRQKVRLSAICGETRLLPTHICPVLYLRCALRQRLLKKTL